MGERLSKRRRGGGLLWDSSATRLWCVFCFSLYLSRRSSRAQSTQGRPMVPCMHFSNIPSLRFGRIWVYPRAASDGISFSSYFVCAATISDIAFLYIDASDDA